MVSINVQQMQPNPAAQQAGSNGISQHIMDAIQSASARTGVNFAYLLNKAQQESSMDPNAKASTSTATGLFQFTGQTWLQMVKNHGAQYGLGDYADHIKVDNNGAAHVSDPVWRNAILALRKDPQVSAEMAGELDKENSSALQANVGGKVGPTELYLAHFLGAGGASDFLKTMKSNPNAPAANILPDAAAANESVFYNADGTPRSVGQIYKHFAQKFDGPANQTATIQVASAAPAQSTTAQQYSASYPASYSAYSMPYMAADSVAANSSYATPVMSGIKPDSSSLFAAMEIAQMHMGDYGAASTTGAAPNHEKKNAISILGAVA